MNIDIIARGIASRAVRPNGKNEFINKETGRIDLIYSSELQALLNAFGSTLPLADYALADSADIQI